MPDDEGLRRLVEEALPETLQPVGARLRWSFGGLTGYGQVVVDVLLPVVERYAARRAAEALREAAEALRAAAKDMQEVADSYGRWPFRVDPLGVTRRLDPLVARLRDRADALAADGTQPHPAHRHDETGAGRG